MGWRPAFGVCRTWTESAVCPAAQSLLPAPAGGGRRGHLRPQGCGEDQGKQWTRGVRRSPHTPPQPCASSQPSQTLCESRQYFLHVTLSFPLCPWSVLPIPVCSVRCFYQGNFAEPGGGAASSPRPGVSVCLRLAGPRGSPLSSRVLRSSTSSPQTHTPPPSLCVRGPVDGHRGQAGRPGSSWWPSSFQTVTT